MDVMFVQDAPRNHEDIGYDTGTLQEFRRSFRKVMSARKVAFVNLVNVILPEDKHPIKKDVQGCSQFFMSVLDKAKPEYIVALGSQVFQVLTGKSRFSDWVGRVINIDKWKVIPMYHPDYAAKSKQREREYQTQVHNVMTILAGSEEEKDVVSYKLVEDPDKIVETLDWLMHDMADLVQAFDYETTHLDPDKGVPVCLSISWEHGKSVCLYFFDIDEWEERRTNSRLTPEIRTRIKMWMLSSVKKTAQNAKFEIKWTKKHFMVEPRNIVGDTKQMQHLVNENVQNRLTDLAYQHTDMGGYDTPMQEFLDDGNEHWQAPPKFMLPYAAGDADCTRRVYVKLRNKIQELGLTWLEQNIVLPAVTTLARIEHRGMQVDWKTVNRVRTYLQGAIATLQIEINGMPEVKRTVAKFHEKNKKLIELNLSSSPQIQYLLYTVLKMPTIRTSKKSGQPSTDAKVLDELKDMHPVINKIVKMRSLIYQLGDLDTIEKRRREDGTVYSDLIQDYVVTGRLSSRDPNLQNIKGDTDEDPSYVKQCFVSRFGKSGNLKQADFSQLELRLVGSESHSEKLFVAFRDGIDLHSMTGADVAGIPLQEFLAHLDKYKPERITGKRINFGTVYGITEHGLAVQLKCSKKEALDKLNRYWDANPEIRQWMKANEREAIENLEVHNRFGRIRHIPEVTSDKWWVRDSALRTASNFKIQSLGADICMWVMVELDNALVERKMKSCVIGQIHDSVLVDVYKSEENAVNELMVEIMEKRTTRLFSFINIPLKIDIESGETWSILKK